MLSIRLRRAGTTKKPHYRVVVADSRAGQVLLVPVGITRALAFTLSTAVLTTTLTTFSPLLSAVTGRRDSGD